MFFNSFRAKIRSEGTLIFWINYFSVFEDCLEFLSVATILFNLCTTDLT